MVLKIVLCVKFKLVVCSKSNKKYVYLCVHCTYGDYLIDMVMFRQQKEPTHKVHVQANHKCQQTEKNQSPKRKINKCFFFLFFVILRKKVNAK